MNTHLLNRAVLNRNALDDDQRKAMFARLGGGSGGGGGWKRAAKRGWDKIKQGVSEMGRLPTPEESLNKLESDAQGRDALIRSALAFTPAGAGVAIDDMMHARKPSDLALASLGALPFVGGLGDDVARGMSAARTPLSKDALLGKFRDALRNIAATGEAAAPTLPQTQRGASTVDKAWDLAVTRLGEKIGLSTEATKNPATRAALDRIMEKIDTKWYTPTGQSRAQEYAREAGLLPGVDEASGKAAKPLAKTVGNIIRQARSRLTGNPANGMVHPELNALNELSAGAKALKDTAIQEHGFVDEATSGALRTLRAEENSIRMGVSKADRVADDLWAHSAPAEGGPDPFATAVRDARARVAARLRADRAALQKPTSVAESSGRYTPSVQARRDAMAAELRRDRELKRLDLHPELFFGNRMPPARSDEERQRRAFFAKGGGPSTARTETNQPGRTSVTVTETGFPRAPVQSGRAEPLQGIAAKYGAVAPPQSRKGGTPPAVPEPGPAPQQGTQAYRDWLKRYAEWERSQPGGELRPWGAGSGPAAPSDRAAKAKADADKIMARAAAKRKQAQGMYPGALQDTGESSFFSKAQLKPAPNSPLARFLALPTLRG